MDLTGHKNTDFGTPDPASADMDLDQDYREWCL